MSSNCLFCKIIKGEIPSEKVFQNESVIGFKDISPMAKEHYLFIHREHTKNINLLVEENAASLNEIFKAIKEFTEKNELAKNGFRIVNNLGTDGGQTVFHTHFHLLGGERLRGFGS